MSNNIVLENIKKYGFQVELINNSPIEMYRCINQLSNLQFILVCLEENHAIPETNMILAKINNEQPIKVVHLINIKNNIDQVIQLVQENKHIDKTFLIYDEDDEIEFFLKDLWNIIIELNRSV